MVHGLSESIHGTRLHALLQCFYDFMVGVCALNSDFLKFLGYLIDEDVLMPSSDHLASLLSVPTTQFQQTGQTAENSFLLPMLLLVVKSC